MIESLSDEQFIEALKWRDQWKEIGLCTDPANRAVAEKAVRKMYLNCGHMPPKLFFWCGSPLSMVMSKAFIKHLYSRSFGFMSDRQITTIDNEIWEAFQKLLENSRGRTVENIWDGAWSRDRQVSANRMLDYINRYPYRSIQKLFVQRCEESADWRKVRAVLADFSVDLDIAKNYHSGLHELNNMIPKENHELWKELSPETGRRVYEMIGLGLEDTVWKNVGAVVAGVLRKIHERNWKIWSKITGDLGHLDLDSREFMSLIQYNISSSVLYGQNDANWLGFYDYCRRVLGLKKQTWGFEAAIEYAKSSGWFIPFSFCACLSERYSLLRLDEKGLLHSEDGPALSYPDGWSIFVWHGTVIPASLIEERDKLTVPQILKEENVQLKNAMLGIYGTERFISETGAVSVSGNGRGKRLLKVPEIGEIPQSKVAEVACPYTGKLELKSVPYLIKDWQQTLAWFRNMASPLDERYLRRFDEAG